MRISCPHCGPRGHDEFAYHGDATLQRPDSAAADALAGFADYAYLRDNPAGAHRELWYHAAGCQRWLVVQRNTLTHVIGGVRDVRDADPAEQPA